MASPGVCEPNTGINLIMDSLPSSILSCDSVNILLIRADKVVLCSCQEELMAMVRFKVAQHESLHQIDKN